MVAKGNGRVTDLPSIQVLAARLQAMENGLQKVAEALTHNSRGVQQAFHFADSHIWVLQRILNDLTKDQVVFTSTEDNSDIQLSWYHHQLNQLNQLMVFSQWVGWLIGTIKEEPEEQEEKSEDVVFGGEPDAAQATNP